MANARLGWFSPLGLAASIRVAVRRVGLRAHCFRFSACADSEWPLGEFVLPPSASELPLSGLAFGLTASAFRHAPLRGYPRRVGSSAFRFGDCHSAGWPSGSRLPLFGMHRFGVAARRVGLRAHDFRFSACTASGLPLGGLAFGLTASAFRHAPLRSCRWASWFCRLPLRGCRSAGWPSGSLFPLFGMHRFGVAAGRVRSSAFRFGDGRSASWPSGSRLPLSACTASGLPSAGWCFCSASWSSGSLFPLFGMHRSAPPRRRREDRRSTTTRHLFHFKTLIPTC